jgi:2-polyprenyl-6-methoxyphenol hydroxylase-like FAD-dependent oxidoreductase
MEGVSNEAAARGPAGAAAAIGLGRAGHSVLVLEAEPFPRFHIGESLLPLADRVFRALGLSERLAAAGFVHKRGAQLKTPDGAHTVLFDFAQADAVQPPWALQVHRAEFDALLLDQARAAGAAVEFARVRDYRLRPDHVEVDCAAVDDGVLRTVRARLLIDASGRAGVIARREGVRTVDTELRKAAVYAHFRGVPVDPGERAGDTRIVSLPQLGWLWFIPLAGGVMSVGAVLDLAQYETLPKGDPAAIFAAAVLGSPFAGQLLAGAERIGEFHVESGFSYRAERYCGERWLLCGDAASFLDPIFSTGVQMAIQAGFETVPVATATLTGIASAAARARARYQRTQQRRYAFVRRFVTGFYDPHTRDIFFAPRRFLGVARAVTTVLAGGFDPGILDRMRLRLFFGLGWLQRHFDLVPRLAGAAACGTGAENSRLQEAT